MPPQLHRITRHAAAAVAVAALAAPAALAADDLRSPDTRDAAFAAQQAAAQGDLRSPDTRDAADVLRTTSWNALAGDLRSPDTRDRAAGRLPVVSTGTIEITVHRPGGFQWTDAGIGAAAGAGLVLLLIGTGLVVRHTGSEPRPA